jgi:hypothetical protein
MITDQSGAPILDQNGDELLDQLDGGGGGGGVGVLGARDYRPETQRRRPRTEVPLGPRSPA